MTIKYLTTTIEFLFDLSLDGPRLRSAFLEDHSNMLHEWNYHSFVRNVACERWAIATCRNFGGTNSYWLYDCSIIN